jgi:hypothetical protein
MSTQVADFLRQHGLESYIMVMQDQGYEDLEDLALLTEDSEALASLIPAMGHRSKLKRVIKTHMDARSSGTGGGGNGFSLSGPVVTAVTQPPQSSIMSLFERATTAPLPDSAILSAAILPPPAAKQSPPQLAEKPHNPLAALFRTPGTVVVKSNVESVVQIKTQQTAPGAVGVAVRPSSAAAQWLAQHDLSMYSEEVQRNGIESFLELSALLSSPGRLSTIMPYPPHRTKFTELILREAALNPAHPLTWMRDVRLPTEDDLGSKLSGGGKEDVAGGEVESGSHTSDSVSILSRLASQVDAKYVRQAPPTTVSTGTGSTAVRVVTVPASTVTASTAATTRTWADVARHEASLEEEGGNERHHDDHHHLAGFDAMLEDDDDDVAPRRSNTPTPPDPMPESSASSPQFVTVAGKRIDVILFENNPGLKAAMKGGNAQPVVICKKSACCTFRDCYQLHYRSVTTRYEGRSLGVCCCHVDGVTAGLIQGLNRGDRVNLCLDFPSCALHEKCMRLHLTVAICGDQRLPMARLSVTGPLIRILESRPTDKKPDANLRICQSFALSQLCLQGSRCNNIHRLPDNGTAKAFYAECKDAVFMRHLRSLQHLGHERYDLDTYFSRSNRGGIELGEAMDFLLWTHCCGCRNMLFEIFRRYTRRPGFNVLWAVGTRLISSGDNDAAISTMMRMTNSALALTQDKMISYTSPLHDIIVAVQEAISTRLRDRNAKFGGAVRQSDNFAHVFWDFDNVLIPDRAELLLFYSSLTSFLCREKIASSRCCITAKAFGTHHSLDNDAVDTLRDMQVETVLCSSKKSEETDRQLERSTRALHHSKQNDTAVILSSDKDFMILAKELARSGVPVITVHSAQKDSQHEAVLHHGSLHSISVLEVYLSMLKSSSIARPFNPWTQRKGEDDHVPQRSINIVAHGASSAKTQQSLSRPQERHRDVRRSRSDSDEVSGDDDDDDDRSGRRNVVIHTRPDVPPALRKAAGGGLQSSFGLAALVAPPRPPANHRVWYQLLSVAYLQRLLDRLRRGECCGVFDPRGSHESSMDHAEVFFDMAKLVPNFLPPNFSTAEAVKECRPRLMNTPSDCWMTVDFLYSFASADNFHDVLQLIRHIGNVVDGPLECMIDPSQLGKVRLLA